MFKNWSLLGVFVLLLQQTNWKCRGDRGMPGTTNGNTNRITTECYMQRGKSKHRRTTYKEEKCSCGEREDEFEMTKILSDNASLRKRREQGVKLSAGTRLSTDSE